MNRIISSFLLCLSRLEANGVIVSLDTALVEELLQAYDKVILLYVIVTAVVQQLFIVVIRWLCFNRLLTVNIRFFVVHLICCELCWALRILLHHELMT